MPPLAGTPGPDWEPEVLEAKAKSIRRDATVGVVAGVAGVLIFNLLFGAIINIVLGLFLGGYVLHSGRDALTDINVYGVERKYRSVAYAAQLLGVLAVVVPVVRLLGLFTQR